MTRRTARAEYDKNAAVAKDDVTVAFELVDHMVRRDA
jgi:hypothetical protein